MTMHDRQRLPETESLLGRAAAAIDKAQEYKADTKSIRRESERSKQSAEVSRDRARKVKNALHNEFSA